MGLLPFKRDSLMGSGVLSLAFIILLYIAGLVFSSLSVGNWSSFILQLFVFNVVFFFLSLNYGGRMGISGFVQISALHAILWGLLVFLMDNVSIGQQFWLVIGYFVIDLILLRWLL